MLYETPWLCTLLNKESLNNTVFHPIGSWSSILLNWLSCEQRRRRWTRSLRPCALWRARVSGLINALGLLCTLTDVLALPNLNQNLNLLQAEAEEVDQIAAAMRALEGEGLRSNQRVRSIVHSY